MSWDDDEEFARLELYAPSGWRRGTTPNVSEPPRSITRLRHAAVSAAIGCTSSSASSNIVIFSDMDESSKASANRAATLDYDLAKPLSSTTGLRQSLSSYGDTHFSLFLRKAFIKALGYSDEALSRPIVGIVNTSSGFNPCHANGPQLLEAAKRGVHLAGGLAVDFPTISLHESFAAPTSMFLRNLMSMDTEEMIRAQPVDAVVMIGGKYAAHNRDFRFACR